MISNAPLDDLTTRSNLNYLREESLVTIGVLAGVAGYIWLWFDIWPVTGSSLPLSAWIGGSALALGSILGYGLRQKNLHLAIHILAWNLLLAAICAVFTFHAAAIEYLLILPVIFGGVLLSQRSVFFIAVLASFSLIVLHLAVPVPQLDAFMPVVIIWMVTVASWISSWTLRTTLAWFGTAYKIASNNERVAREHEGELRRLVKALDDVTLRLERTNYSLTLERNQANEARRLKQHFVQTISHELRTPLNLIVGFTELMSQSPEYYGTPLPTGYMRDLTIVHRNARHLQNLVNDVLDLARIEAAQMSVIPEETDPGVLVQEAVNTALSLVETRGLKLNVSIAPNLPHIWIDSTRIRQVLFNLLNNAARFTEAGSVSVTVKHTDDDLIFSVVDTGCGIAEEHLPRLFREFEQLDSSTRRRHGGAGLGLAISRHFVEMHHGRIWAESELGKGSAFSFSLPVTQSKPSIQVVDLGTIPSDPTELKSQGERILLAVTRSPSAATLLSRYVQGCRTVVVQDLKQAYNVATHLLPQMVVIDTSSEPQDQNSFQTLVQEWGLAGVPFVAYPLFGEDMLRQQLAVDGYLVKPVSTQSLDDLLYQLGENHERILVIDDDHDFVRLLSRMLDRPLRHHQVINAYTGHEALMHVSRYKPSLIFLDLKLPDIDGNKLIEKIRSMPGQHESSIVVVSGQEPIDSIDSVGTPILLARQNKFVPGDLIHTIQYTLDTLAKP